jgi:hypothetical protein
MLDADAGRWVSRLARTFVSERMNNGNDGAQLDYESIEITMKSNEITMLSLKLLSDSSSLFRSFLLAFFYHYPPPNSQSATK